MAGRAAGAMLHRGPGAANPPAAAHAFRGRKGPGLASGRASASRTSGRRPPRVARDLWRAAADI